MSRRRQPTHPPPCCARRRARPRRAPWYTDRYSEARWIADWVRLAQRYAGNDAVIGADLHNEPHGPATWGDGNRATDWRLAAERAGNAILRANPHWLIFVEGVEHLGTDWYWWGGNLAAARRYPDRLAVRQRLIYEVHDYGPEVNNQGWFDVPSHPKNLPGLWEEHWGYLQDQGMAPVLVGEFGGNAVDSGKERAWIHALMTYIRGHGLSYTFWCLNPNSGDTGGLLEDGRTLTYTFSGLQVPAGSATVAARFDFTRSHQNQNRAHPYGKDTYVVSYATTPGGPLTAMRGSF